MDDKELFVVGIGASAGGIPPLIDFFSHIPDPADMAFVVVQHLDRTYKSQMNSILSRYTQRPIYVITDGMKINPGCIYLMPQNTKVHIEGGHLFLKERRPEEVVNYAIDEFFFSLAQDVKEKAIGIILSGMGTDGTKGAVAIEQVGGIVMVQDPESSEYDSMTSSVVYNDHPDYILYPKEMGKHLLAYIHRKV